MTLASDDYARRGGRVAVTYGHDAADIAVFSQFGPALAPTAMQVAVDLLEQAPI